MSGIKEIIDSPHPVYLQNVGYWNFLLQSYEGGRNYTNSAIRTGSGRDGNKGRKKTGSAVLKQYH